MSYRAIASQTLGSATGTVDFNNIPTVFRDLVFVINGNTSGNSNIFLRFNADANGANYFYVTMTGNGSSTNSQSGSGGANLGFPIQWTSTGNQNALVNFLDYSATDKHKSILARVNSASNVAGAFSYRWANTAAITRVEIIADANFAAGTTFALYGVTG